MSSQILWQFKKGEKLLNYFFYLMFILTPLIMYEQADLKVQIKNNTYRHQFSSVQSLQSLSGEKPWLQHTRPPCPLPTPRDYSNSCPSSQWCHPAISYSVISFSSCPQSLKASGSFPMSQLFTWGGRVLEFQLQHQSFQWTPRTDFL